MNGKFASPEFYLCPITVHSAGIMSYYVMPSGPAIEPYSKEHLPPGNYGWYYDHPGECTSRGFPPRTRDANLRVSKSDSRIKCLRWIDLRWTQYRQLLRKTDDFGGGPDHFDSTPFFVSANVFTMQAKLVFHLLSNHFTVDVDDAYWIVFRTMDGLEGLLPTHFPRDLHHETATDYFLHLHCHHSRAEKRAISVGSEVYSNWSIIAAMHNIGVDYIGSDSDPDGGGMAPLSDERWQTELGQAILAEVLEERTAAALERLEQAADSEETPESPMYNSLDESLKPIRRNAERSWTRMSNREAVDLDRVQPRFYTVEPLLENKSGPQFVVSAEDALVAWIIPPAVARQPLYGGCGRRVPYPCLTLNGWRARPPAHTPPAHAQQDEAADHFLRLHYHYSLKLILGGDISEVYSNGTILSMMQQLGVDHIGNEDRDPQEMALLDDKRWQTALGKVILENVLNRDAARSLDWMNLA
ncbi:hypothetical protein DFH09DRAFT_1076850 [Mycena vulgaris]|nr:hypothetical protein DFH09DRAFT_1076850 [Mycena vulgaris]